MGRSYTKEIERLPETYAWATGLDISELIRAIIAAAERPLYAIGSGGSLTAAEMVCSMYERTFRSFAKVLTPLELEDILGFGDDLSLWLFSASGRNTDIRRALSIATFLEPSHLSVVCAKDINPLVTSARKYDHIDVFSFDPPTGKDGFLATNSLLATVVLITRAFSAVLSSGQILPDNLDDIIFNAIPDFNELFKSIESNDYFWDKSTKIILYSPQLKPAAYDIESRFTEAALGSIQTADFRNFGHGRHIWLSKHDNDTAVISFNAPNDNLLSAKTLDLIPENIPKISFDFKSDWLSSYIVSIVISMRLAQLAGFHKKVNPGRPGVPEFGRKLYHLKTSPGRKRVSWSKSTVAISRKFPGFLSTESNNEDAKLWEKSYKEYKKTLLRAEFHSVVFDYDGTLVDVKKRYFPPRSSIADELNRILDNRVRIGIATGRGQSVRKDLRTVIDKKHWDSVLIGYYNCAEHGLLSDDRVPDNRSDPSGVLQSVAIIIEADNVIRSIKNFKKRKHQLTLEISEESSSDKIWKSIQHLVLARKFNNIKVLRSSHSIDIITKEVTKVAILKNLCHNQGNGVILSIGDKGEWPGNDFELLAEPYTLSVDQVSNDSQTCWNLAPAGIRGPQATMYYLKCLKIKKTPNSTRLVFKNI